MELWQYDATDLARFSGEPFPALASRLGVCAASHVSLHAGRAGAPVWVSGCASASPWPSDPVFQAASLTKPVVAFAALHWGRIGLGWIVLGAALAGWGMLQFSLRSPSVRA